MKNRSLVLGLNIGLLLLSSAGAIFLVVMLLRSDLIGNNMVSMNSALMAKDAQNPVSREKLLSINKLQIGIIQDLSSGHKAAVVVGTAITLANIYAIVALIYISRRRSDEIE